MKRLTAFLPLIIVVVLGLFLAIGLTRDPSKIPSARIGKPVPQFALEPLEATGAGIATGDLARGEPVLVNFFASWCVPCRVEHPLLMSLQEEGFRLYGIAYKDKRADTRDFLEELGNPFDRVGADLNGRAGIEWGSTGVPETFVVSGDGRILFQHLGPLTAEVVTQEIRPLLGGS